AVDPRLRSLAESAPSAAARTAAAALVGRVAVANSRRAYAAWREILSSPRWRRLEAAGARPQRLLWASTGTEDPSRSDVLYVEELAGPDTVNTMPPATLDAFRDHGRVRAALLENPAPASEALAALESLGISLSEVTDRLLVEGLSQFGQA